MCSTSAASGDEDKVSDIVGKKKNNKFRNVSIGTSTEWFIVNKRRVVSFLFDFPFSD